MLKEKLEQLQELKGEEFTLPEMDNTVQRILESESSIFDGETEDYIEDGEYAYTTWENENKDDTIDINIHFEVVEENEDPLQTIVTVADIEIL